MSSKEKELQKQYTQIEQELKAAKGNSNEKMIKAAVDYYTKHKDSLDFDSKKAIIRQMVKQIYVSKDHEEVDIHLF